MTFLRALVPALVLALGLAVPAQAATWKITFFDDANPAVPVGGGTFVPNVTTLDPNVWLVSAWTIEVNGVSYPQTLTTPPTFSVIDGTAFLGFALQASGGLLILASTPPNGATQFWATQDCGQDNCPTTASGTFTLAQVTDAPAVIPLPATAALLPLGLGALALMRRRRARG
jgi:hypothetical protein